MDVMLLTCLGKCTNQMMERLASNRNETEKMEGKCESKIILFGSGRITRWIPMSV